MLRRTLIALFVALAATWAPADTWAQETDEALAKKYYQLGKELYDRSDYEGALAQFKQSHKYSKKPALIFNIARCHEGLGQVAEAIQAFESFLKTKPANAGQIRGRIANLKRRLKKQQPAPDQPTPDKPAPDQPAPDQPAPDQPVTPVTPDKPVTPDPEPEKQGRSGALGIAGWVTLGAGAAALITGVVLGAMAAEKSSALEDAAFEGAFWPDHRNDWDTGESLELGQIIGLAAGGALAATGAVLLYLHYRNSGKDSGERQAWIAPGVLPGGACLSGTWHF